MPTEANTGAGRPLVTRSGESAISAVGGSLVIHEWTGSGPDYMHVHHSDDEAWHVPEGSLSFKFADGEVGAQGTTVFVPAGNAHTYKEVEPSRYLIVPTPRINQLIAELHSLPDDSQLATTLARYDTEVVS